MTTPNNQPSASQPDWIDEAFVELDELRPSIIDALTSEQFVFLENHIRSHQPTPRPVPEDVKTAANSLADNVIYEGKNFRLQSDRDNFVTIASHFIQSFLDARDRQMDLRILKEYPDLKPSGDFDLLDEVLGLLRVTRSQRDSAEKDILIVRERLAEQKKREKKGVKVLEGVLLQSLNTTAAREAITTLIAEMKEGE